DFDPASVTPGDTLVSAGSADAFVLQLNTTGGFVRAGRLGSAGADAGLAVAADAAGNVAVTGSFTNTTTGLAALSANVKAGAAFTDLFVLKLKPSGTGFTTAGGWAQSFGAEGDDAGRAIAFDASGNVLVAGEFRFNVDFDFDPS